MTANLDRLRAENYLGSTGCLVIFLKQAAVSTSVMAIVPSLVGQLLLGEELTGVAIPVGRVAGIALIALGAACWPGPPLVGMLIYSALVTLYLAYLGFAGGFAGIFLWPAVALHAVLSLLLGRAWLAELRRDKGAADFRSGQTLQIGKLNVRYWPKADMG
jgi:hypothetical protein